MDKSRGYERFGGTIQVPLQANNYINIEKAIKSRLAFMIGEYIMENIDDLPLIIEQGTNIKHGIVEYRIKGILISEEKLKMLLSLEVSDGQ